MGNIKTRMIKRVAKQLVDAYPDVFSLKFEENKPVVQKLINADSKRTLNKVTGSVTRILKTRSRPQEEQLDLV
ncbi:MAG: 30S ribosomal protein S17e [Candidatus Marsarchaeota archaeon]|nr:30S ribosomal protein S17e [Candidatus Marsarchaeota archaeon]